MAANPGGKAKSKLKVLLPEEEQRPYHISNTGTFQEDDLVINEKGITLLKTPNPINRRVSSASHPTPPDSSLFEEEDDGSCKVKLDDLETIKEVGRGQGGCVFLAKNKRTGELIAQKVIPLDLDDKVRRPVLQELRSLYACDCPQIVTFYGAFLVKGNIQICLEYMDAGSLQDISRANGPIAEPYLANISEAVLRGLRYLHKERRIMHRDIKPSNITANIAGEVKICDFGISGELASTMGSFNTWTGTTIFMSPERIKGDTYTSASDVWSLGMSVAELVLGRSPYSQLKDEFWKLLEAIVSDTTPLVVPEDGHSAELCDFVALTLEKDPLSRPSADDLLSHPFLKCAASRNEMSEWLRPYAMCQEPPSSPVHAADVHPAVISMLPGVQPPPPQGR